MKRIASGGSIHRQIQELPRCLVFPDNNLLFRTMSCASGLINLELVIFLNRSSDLQRKSG